MVPRGIKQLDAFPMTINGKLDIQKLKKLLRDVTYEDKELKNSKELTSDEKKILNVYKKIFKNEHLTIMDNFFELGGDSIQAIRIVSLLSDFEVSVDDILKYPTISQLVGHLKKNKNTVSQEEVSGQFKLLPSQNKFVSWVKEIEADHFNQSFLVKSRELIDYNTLNTIYHKLLKHHDSLRICYSYGVDFATILNYKSLKIKMNVVSIECLESELEAVATEQQRSLSLKEGDVFRLVSIRTEKEQYLLFILHHFISDAVSMRIIFDDFCTLYRNQSDEKALPLKTNSLIDYSEELFVKTDEKVFEEDKEFWKKNKFSSFTNNKQLCTVSKSRHLKIDFGRELSAQIRGHINQDININIRDLLVYSFLMAVFKVYRSLEHFTIDFEGYGRNIDKMSSNVSRTIGWFTSIYPITFKRFSKDMSLESKLHNIHEYLEEIPNGGVSYYLTRKEEAQSYAPVLFNYLGEFDSKEETDADLTLLPATIGQEVSGNINMQNPMIINIAIQDAQLVADFRYDKSIYNYYRMQRIVFHFKNNLKWYLKSVSKSNSSILDQLKDYNPGNDLVDVMNSGSSKNIFIFPPAMLKVAYIPLYKKIFSNLDYKCHILHLLNDKDIVEKYAEYIISQNCEELVFVGYSGGANIAYDTASFLEKNFNIKVKTIIMIDGFKWEDGLDFVVVNEKNIDEMLEEFLK
ncbi:condensation domain-containing protein [Streptococcus ratti]|uniref:Carrier domain-containing protein n=1 Tax=Streptococcus ratti TaxID=1341 RepID=A0A7X9LF18_STRRT|nr:condensation domain-containing protein [Streptococcus ratti]NMD49804.1 hypothetical protein [Streptococcus ratti]